MRISTTQMYDRSVHALLRNQEEVSQIQNKIASGKNINSPSDDPVASSRILAIHNEQSVNSTYKKTMDFAEGQLELIEATFGAVSSAIIRARQLVIQANNSALSFEDKINISAELKQIRYTLVDLANTKDSSGNYLFSGSKVKQAAVSLNSQGEYIFNGDNASRYVQISNTQRIAITDSIKQAFFNLPTASLATRQYSGLASQSVMNTGLQNVGNLNSLDAGDLLINQVDIGAASSDGVSDISAQKSALAIVSAINQQLSATNVLAQVSDNVVNLGSPTLGNLTTGDLTINGRQISGNFTTNQQLINAINIETSQTGIIASDNTGDIILTATDGRNIHLQTDGTTAGATFANFDLNGGVALNQLQRAGFTLSSEASFQIDGAAVSDIGLTLASVSATANTGLGVINNVKVVNAPSTIPERYLIKFNALNPTANYSIYAASNPNIPVTGYDNKSYISGEKITIDGTSFDISGTVQPGDTFLVTVENQASQDIFKSMDFLIESVKDSNADATEISYNIGIALDNLNYFEASVLEARAKIGARLNIIENQQAANSNVQFINDSSLSLLEDLDYSKAISEFSQKKMILDAAQQSFVKLQSLSLFNYM